MALVLWLPRLNQLVKVGDAFCPHWCLDQFFFLVQPKLGKLITAFMNWTPEDMPRSLKV